MQGSCLSCCFLGRLAEKPVHGKGVEAEIVRIVSGNLHGYRTGRFSGGEASPKEFISVNDLSCVRRYSSTSARYHLSSVCLGIII